MNYLVKIIVKFKNSKTNEAVAIQNVIENLFIADVDISCAKYYELNIKALGQAQAIEKASLIAEKVLVNPIIEKFEIIEAQELSEGSQQCELV